MKINITPNDKGDWLVWEGHQLRGVIYWREEGVKTAWLVRADLVGANLFDDPSDLVFYWSDNNMIENEVATTTQ